MCNCPIRKFSFADSSLPQKFSPIVLTERVHFFVVVEVCEEVPSLLADERKLIVVEEFLVGGLPPQIPRTL